MPKHGPQQGWIRCAGLFLWTISGTDVPVAGAEPPAVVQAEALDGLPADVRPKIRALAELLQQSIQSGRLSDAQLQRELLAGDLQQAIRGLGPEAERLLEDIKPGIRSGSSEEALSHFLGALAPSSP